MLYIEAVGCNCTEVNLKSCLNWFNGVEWKFDVCTDDKEESGSNYKHHNDGLWDYDNSKDICFLT